ncbi:lipopolysaccharide biosynthesis protein [Acinetobacter soli]|uniref:lipopolysaccharide biosynthesis protein n=1 Tax=Acinetobacter soli TaxID=487316 RepID=UPI00125D8229|nr:hypothetical protein [Acinetobacter soli]MCF3128335.1 hypothetical protein [Acinetobacter soli]
MIKLFKNFLGYGYGQIVTIIIQFLLVPFFLKYWGVEQYSDWLLLTGIPLMLAIMDFGVAGAMGNFALINVASKKINQAIVAIQTGLLCTSVIAFFIIIISIILGYLFNWSDILNLKIINNHESSIIFIFISIYVGICLFNSSTDALFKVIDKVAFGAFILSNRRMVDVFVTIFVLICGYGPVTLAILMVLGQVLYQIYMFYYISSNSNYNYIGIKKFSFKLLRKLIIPSLSSMGFPLSQVLVNQVSIQIVNFVSNNSQVVVAFSMARTLMRLIFQFTMVMNLAIKPIISNYIGNKDSLVGNKFVKKISFLSIIFVLFIYLILGCFGPLFLDLWSHGKVKISSSELFLIGIHAVANATWFVYAATTIANNTHTKLSIYYSIGAVLGCLTGYYLSGIYGAIFTASYVLLIPELFAIFYYIQFKSILRYFKRI